MRDVQCKICDKRLQENEVVWSNGSTYHDKCLKEKSGNFGATRNAVLADVPSLQDYLKWALEPEDGFRTHEEIYNYFARYFS